jgi:hypothetical protein
VDDKRGPPVHAIDDNIDKRERERYREGERRKRERESEPINQAKAISVRGGKERDPATRVGNVH